MKTRRSGKASEAFSNGIDREHRGGVILASTSKQSNRRTPKSKSSKNSESGGELSVAKLKAKLLALVKDVNSKYERLHREYPETETQVVRLVDFPKIIAESVTYNELASHLMQYVECLFQQQISIFRNLYFQQTRPDGTNYHHYLKKESIVCRTGSSLADLIAIVEQGIDWDSDLVEVARAVEREEEAQLLQEHLSRECQERSTSVSMDAKRRRPGRPRKTRENKELVSNVSESTEGETRTPASDGHRVERTQMDAVDVKTNEPQKTQGSRKKPGRPGRPRKAEYHEIEEDAAPMVEPEEHLTEELDNIQAIEAETPRESKRSRRVSFSEEAASSRVSKVRRDSFSSDNTYRLIAFSSDREELHQQKYDLNTQFSIETLIMSFHRFLSRLFSLLFCERRRELARRSQARVSGSLLDRRVVCASTFPHYLFVIALDQHEGIYRQLRCLWRSLHRQ